MNPNEQIPAAAHLTEQSQFSLESIGCQTINCYLCQKRGIINPIVVKMRYELTQNNLLLSGRIIRPICDLHSATPVPKSENEEAKDEECQINPAQSDKEYLANKAVISKWMSLPPQPTTYTGQSTYNFSHVVCCEPKRDQ